MGNVSACAWLCIATLRGRKRGRPGDDVVHRVAQRRHADEVGQRRRDEERREVERQPVVGEVEDDVELVLVDARPLAHRRQHAVGRHADQRVPIARVRARLQRSGNLVHHRADVQRTCRRQHLDLVTPTGEAEHQAVQRQFDAATDAAAQAGRPASR